MIRLTKIFHFEMAHAIHGYTGDCKNIHGHSYKLHVTVASANNYTQYIPAPGFVIDFKELKKLVKAAVIEKLNHKMILSSNFLSDNPSFASQENLVIWEEEPTTENLLLYILYMMQILFKKFPNEVNLVQLKLYETNDSYAEWINDHPFNL